MSRRDYLVSKGLREISKAALPRAAAAAAPAAGPAAGGGGVPPTKRSGKLLGAFLLGGAVGGGVGERFGTERERRKAERERMMVGKAEDDGPRYIGPTAGFALGGVPGAAIGGAIDSPKGDRGRRAAYAGGGAALGTVPGIGLATIRRHPAGIPVMLAGGMVGSGVGAHYAGKRKKVKKGLRGVSKREARFDDLMYSGEELGAIKRDKQRAAMGYGGAGTFLGGAGALAYETSARGGYGLPPVRGKVLAGGGAATLGGLGLMVGSKLRERKVGNRVRVAQGKAPRDFNGLPKDFYEPSQVNKGLPRAMRPFSEGGSYAGGTYGTFRRLASDSGKGSGQAAARSRKFEARVGNGDSFRDRVNTRLAELEEKSAVERFYSGTRNRKDSRQYLDLLTPKKSRPNLP